MKQVKAVVVLNIGAYAESKEFERELGDIFESDSDNRMRLDSLESFWEVSDPIVSGRKEVKFAGKIIGFPLRGENAAMTEARLLLEAEQRINQVGDIRAHINGDKK